jgi:hypothetical protein
MVLLWAYLMRKNPTLVQERDTNAKLNKYYGNKIDLKNK